jgi:hypothetical protein
LAGALEIGGKSLTGLNLNPTLTLTISVVFAIVFIGIGG